MGLITKVKAGSVSSLSDARYFAGMGVDWLGYDVDPNSESYVSPELFKNIAGWVAGPNRIIELSASSIHHLNDLVQEYSPEGVQLPFGSVSTMPILSLPVFATANLHSFDICEVESSRNKIEYLVLDVSQQPQQELAKDLAGISKHVKILLAITPDTQDIKQLLKNLPIAGVALKGSKELKTGIKDYGYSELLEQLESE